MSGRRVRSFYTTGFSGFFVDDNVVRGLQGETGSQSAIDRSEIMPDGSFYDPDVGIRAPMSPEVFTAKFLLFMAPSTVAAYVNDIKDNIVGYPGTVNFVDGGSMAARCTGFSSRDISNPISGTPQFSELVLTFREEL